MVLIELAYSVYGNCCGPNGLEASSMGQAIRRLGGAYRDSRRYCLLHGHVMIGLPHDGIVRSVVYFQ